ncbi:MAG TPA: hypothetical protein PLD49_07500 [Thermoclostridium caenicola]|uniref:Uncharacterized protein n=1 Tax=Thermoclostridium caenicola TaxID=659425 RepID=A0A1M6ICK8_9FIRM|nr:hypothetical protein [Thermoclostridium caenicola]SHJ32046.1 hypothetical protein SAMN05444373_104110 [Thermoclostridium caenicola]HOK43493.1 hypothetical protein [Thermoclostridium caenicola]HOL85531.1 hypothetical protein [Thermoclostridium caenicola]HPO77697.1 hypothetical protein [Thermoclostridium caenicola]
MSAERRPLNHTRKLTLTGILSALVVLALVLESIAPTGRLGFYVLAAFILSVILLECGIRFAWAGYVVTSVAGFIAVPEKLNIIPYIAFFGIYTVLKYHIESLRVVWLEIVLKLAAFNLFLWPAWSLAKTFLPEALTMGWGVPAAGAVLQILFLLYDYLFTLWIRYYFEKIAPRVRKD